jgi:phage-related baseplate assembly protein
MSSRFLAPDLSLLASAKLIEEIDAEAILASQKAWILARWAEIRVGRPDLPVLDTLGLETEPMTILLQAYAYRETLLRALVNDKARAVLLAYATGTDLDHLGALFGVVRMEIASGVMESDERLRRRIQLAPEAFSVAGPRGAYIFHALTIDGSVADAWAYSPRDGEVIVVVAGEAGADLSDAVLAKLVDRFAREDTVPLTDAVMVRRAERIDYAVEEAITVPRGPDANLLRAKAIEAITVYGASRCRIGATVFRSGLITAGAVGGVEGVELQAPTANVVPAQYQIPRLTGVVVNVNISE